MASSKYYKITVWVITVMALIFLVSLPVLAENLPAWAAMTSGTTNDLYAIWGSGSSNVFAVGSAGTIMRYDGTAWAAMNSGTKNELTGVWGTSGSNVFAVGSAGTIMRYDGTAWAAMTSGTTNDLYAIWGSGSSNVFAVGSAGTIMRYDGTAWAAMNSGTKSDLYAIWGSGSSNVFAVGSAGTIMRYDGTAWAAMNSGTKSDLYAIWGTSNGNMFVVGKSSVIAFYDGTKFTPMNRSSITDLRTACGFSSTDVFAAGMSGTILRYLPPLIYSVSPDQGYQGSKLDVTITGTNLTAASEIRFGSGIAVNSFTVLSGNQITANIEIIAGAKTGPRDISVTTPGGIVTLPNGFKVNLALPVIASISPNQDRQGATLNVTITGTNLTAASEIRFGSGIAVNSFTVLSGNQITANITIAADAMVGARDISVTTPGGNFTLPANFTVKQALPIITTVSPIEGNREKTIGVTISGKNLANASEIRFGSGIAVNSFTVLSGNQITANITIAADAMVGARDVSVTTPGGSYALPASFTVKQALPIITSLGPDNGNQGATLTININGSNFNGASEVRFGTGIAVNNMIVIDSTHIEAKITIIAGTETGAKDVSVTTPGGSDVLVNGFTVIQSLPVITSISPENASRGTSMAVIISGGNLEGASSVSFGTGTAVSSFTNLSPTQLLVNVVIYSDAVTGPRDVSVTTPGGSSTLSNRFNIKEQSLSTLILVLIWAGIAAAGTLLLFILNKLRQKRAARY